jgi:hypothetical protein
VITSQRPQVPFRLAAQRSASLIVVSHIGHAITVASNGKVTDTDSSQIPQQMRDRSAK